MKKVVSLVISLLLIIGIVPISASAETTSITQDGITYEIDTATGEAEVCDSDESIVTAEIASEINGYPVTSISWDAFYNCTSLTSVTIPDSVTSIGGCAFSGCTSLTSVTIPDSVTSIGNWAFEDCTSLTEIDVDENNQNYCSENGILFTKDKTELIQYPAGKSDTSYTIPDSVTSIDNYAFWDCTSLTSVTIPDSVTSIGDEAFYSCTSLTSVTIPDSVTSISYEAFYNCTSLTSVTIPDSVTSIGEYAFSDCTSLTSVTIPDSVTSIGEYAFRDCASLTSVTIGGSVTSIGDEAFGYYYDYGYEKIENFTIYGYTGSAAETYANENGFTFIDVENMPETPTTQGDLNGDGKVSVADARLMLVAIAGGNDDNQYIAIADLNGDGKLSIADARSLLVKIANGEDLGYNEIDYTAEQSLSEMAFDVMKYNLLLSEDGNANTTANSLTFAALNAMIAEGADDESAKILNDLFFYGNRNEAMDIVESYTDISDITLANSAFVRDGFDIKTTYTDSLKLKFNADIFTNKAFDQTTVEEINNWSFNKTNGLVGSPVNSLDIESNLVLNSVSTFSANWLFPFNKDATKEDVFTNADGSKKTVQMMTEYPAAIGDYNGNTVYMKSFENERFKFIAVMPDEDIVEYTFNFNCETLHNILTKTLMCQDVIKVCLPKFSIENEIDFTDVYKFYEINFSNISDTELTIGPVKQKNVVSIDENGVCAASAAQAVISTEVVDRTVKFDRPFMYMIVDTENEVALYSGTVCNIGE